MTTFDLNIQTEELDPTMFGMGFEEAIEAEIFGELELQARQDGSVTNNPNVTI